MARSRESDNHLRLGRGGSRLGPLRSGAAETLRHDTFRLHSQTDENLAAEFHERRRAAKKEVPKCNVLDGILDEFTAYMAAWTRPLRVRLRQQNMVLEVLQPGS